jgi:hypothetical protein
LAQLIAIRVGRDALAIRLARHATVVERASRSQKPSATTWIRLAADHREERLTS